MLNDWIKEEMDGNLNKFKVWSNSLNFDVACLELAYYHYNINDCKPLWYFRNVCDQRIISYIYINFIDDKRIIDYNKIVYNYIINYKNIDFILYLFNYNFNFIDYNRRSYILYRNDFMRENKNKIIKVDFKNKEVK